MSAVTMRETSTGSRHVPPSHHVGSLVPAIALVILMAAYAGLFCWLSLDRYYAFQMHALDMGNMGQAAWNTIHGHPFFFTNMRLQYNIEAWHTTNRLSFHVEALFPLISLVYLIYPHPESLLILQTVALALGAIPVYWLANDVLRNRWLALVFSLAYLLFPTLEGMNLYEFHPVALATPLLLFAFVFAYRRRYVLFAVCSLAAMGTKEEIGLVVAMFGLYIMWKNRDVRIGLATIVVGAGWSLVAAGVIEPHFRHPPTVTYIRSRYPYLGHGVSGVIHAVTHPGDILATLFILPKLSYLLRLLAPGAFLALLAPWALLLGLPTFALNLLSVAFPMYSGLGQDSAELISVVMISSILGAEALLRRLGDRLPGPRAAVALGTAILLISLWDQHVEGFTPLGTRFQIPHIGQHQALESRFVGMIPPGVPVSTQDELDPALSSRHYLYLFADTGREPYLAPADWILLDASAPTYPLPSNQLHDYALGWIHRPGWGIAAAQDGLILIHKGATNKGIPSTFYSFALADHASIDHTTHLSAAGLSLVGYDVQHTDLPNHYIPNLAYTFYLRPNRATSRNIQPVLFEVLNGQAIGCASHPLGLDWLPTSRWRAGHTYAVRMGPLETAPQNPGTARLYVGLAPVPVKDQDCASWWSKHGTLVSVGTLDIGF